MNANEPLARAVAAAVPVMPAEPLEYFRQTLHPLRRAVKFLAWFGVVMAILGLAHPILIWLGPFFVRAASFPSSGWVAPHAASVTAVQWLNAGLLLVASIACLRRWRVGRWGMILYAYVALVMFGVGQFVNLYWITINAPKSPSMQIWFSWLLTLPGPAINQLVFPVLILVVLRDRIVREFFEQRLSD